MECRYCQSANADDDHRCRRCGRRLRMGPVYTGSSAAAPLLQYTTAEVHHSSAQPAAAQAKPGPNAVRRPASSHITYQPSLFTSRELPRVVPFETIAPDLVQQ